MLFEWLGVAHMPDYDLIFFFSCGFCILGYVLPRTLSWSTVMVVVLARNCHGVYTLAHQMLHFLMMAPTHLFRCGACSPLQATFSGACTYSSLPGSHLGLIRHQSCQWNFKVPAQHIQNTRDLNSWPYVCKASMCLNSKPCTNSPGQNLLFF